MVNGAIGRTNLPRKAENQEELQNVNIHVVITIIIVIPC